MPARRSKGARSLAKPRSKFTKHLAMLAQNIPSIKPTAALKSSKPWWMNEHGSQVNFNMAFTYLTLAGAADKSDLLWFVMDFTISDAVALGSKCAAALFNGHLAQTLKPQLDPVPAPTGKKAKKSVRFQMPTPAIIPSLDLLISLLPATMIPLALDLKDSMRTQLFASLLPPTSTGDHVCLRTRRHG